MPAKINKKMAIPTKNEILALANVPVEIAAAYLGISAQAVRCGIRTGNLPIGTPIQSRCSIPPQKLIAYKEGLDTQERVSTELQTIGVFLESGVITYAEILNIVIQKKVCSSDSPALPH